MYSMVTLVNDTMLKVKRVDLFLKNFFNVLFIFETGRDRA